MACRGAKPLRQNCFGSRRPREDRLAGEAVLRTEPAWKSIHASKPAAISAAGPPAPSGFRTSRPSSTARGVRAPNVLPPGAGRHAEALGAARKVCRAGAGEIASQLMGRERRAGRGALHGSGARKISRIRASPGITPGHYRQWLKLDGRPPRVHHPKRSVLRKSGSSSVPET